MVVMGRAGFSRVRASRWSRGFLNTRWTVPVIIMGRAGSRWIRRRIGRLAVPFNTTVSVNDRDGLQMDTYSDRRAGCILNQLAMVAELESC